jgi:hypothetical protein
MSGTHSISRIASRYPWILPAVLIGFGLGYLAHAMIGGSQENQTVSEQLNSGLPKRGRSPQEGEAASRTSRSASDGAASAVARRYERALSILAEEGNFIPALGFGDNLDPSDKMAEFFDLSPEDFAQLKEVAARARREIQEWEISHAVAIESEEHQYAYEIAVDSDFVELVRERFNEGMQGVVGSDGAKILTASAGQFFDESKTRRRVTMDVIDRDQAAREVRFNALTLGENGEVTGTSSSNYYEFPENSGKKNFGSFRYQHLLRGG